MCANDSEMLRRLDRRRFDALLFPTDFASSGFSSPFASPPSFTMLRISFSFWRNSTSLSPATWDVFPSHLENSCHAPPFIL